MINKIIKQFVKELKCNGHTYLSEGRCSATHSSTQTEIMLNEKFKCTKCGKLININFDEEAQVKEAFKNWKIEIDKKIGGNR